MKSWLQNLHTTYIHTVFLTFILLLIFACADLPSSLVEHTDLVEGTGLKNVIKSNEAKLAKLTFSYGEMEYNHKLDLDNPSADITIDIPIVRPLGILPTDSFVVPKVSMSKVLTSSKASYVMSSKDINFDNSEPITIEVTAEDGTKKKYNLAITYTVGEKGGFSILNTYASSDEAILGQGFLDTLMPDETVVITISHLTENAIFRWSLKDSSDNTLTAGEALKIANSDGEIYMLKSDFAYVDDNEKIKKRGKLNTEEIFTLELSQNTHPDEKASQIITYSPYKLFTWQDVQAMRLDLEGNYILQQDVTFPDKEQSGFPAEGFEPIGRDTEVFSGGGEPKSEGFDLKFNGKAFTGTFDGKGHVMSNFSISRRGESYIGLFGQIDGSGIGKGIVKNFILKHVGILGNYFVGSIAGVAQNGQIFNVGMTSTDSVAGEGKEKTTNAEGNYVGGLVGYSLSSYIAGYVEGQGDVSGGEFVGGLAGAAEINDVIGYSAVVVTGKTDVGGLVGYNKGGGVFGYSIGTVVGNRHQSRRVGGLVGKNTGGTVVGYVRGYMKFNSYYNGDPNIGYLVGINDRSNNRLSLGTTKGYYEKKGGYHRFAHRDGGTVISVGANTKRSDFKDIEQSVFGSSESVWIFTNGKWPAINFGPADSAIKTAAEQPIDP